MGLFSKLFGKISDTAADMYGDEKHFFDNLRPDDAPPQPAPKPQKGASPQQAQPRGLLPWGPVMPAEENQYSVGGNYVDYFARVFREEFPDYQVTHAPAERIAATVFTFERNGSTKLIVEVMSENCTSKKLRRECQNSGMPYLRFYYNHFGWWNARSYVAGRVRTALSV
ncbi:MAG: hypothetical protein IKP95_03050 [Ruminococcus sp.]|nr:hypothetical protein [Ruminococcus sp.]